jgi:hypothetical protein
MASIPYAWLESNSHRIFMQAHTFGRVINFVTGRERCSSVRLHASKAMNPARLAR